MTTSPLRSTGFDIHAAQGPAPEFTISWVEDGFGPIEHAHTISATRPPAGHGTITQEQGGVTKTVEFSGDDVTFSILEHREVAGHDVGPYGTSFSGAADGATPIAQDLTALGQAVAAVRNLGRGDAGHQREPGIIHVFGEDLGGDGSFNANWNLADAPVEVLELMGLSQQVAKRYEGNHDDFRVIVPA